MNILKLPDVKALTKLSRSTIYQLCANNAFPERVKLTQRTVGWIEDEILEWLEQRAAARTLH